MRTNNDLLNNQKSTEGTYSSIEKSGSSQDDINVMMFKDNVKKYYAKEAILETGINKVTVCAAIGGALGGTLGAMIGAIAAVGTTLVLPGFGLVIAGPIAAAIAGASVGGLFAGLVGALIGWLIPENHLIAYEQNIYDGGNLTRDKSKFEDKPSQFDNHWENHHGRNMLS